MLSLHVSGAAGKLQQPEREVFDLCGLNSYRMSRRRSQILEAKSTDFELFVGAVSTAAFNCVPSSLGVNLASSNGDYIDS